MRFLSYGKKLENLYISIEKTIIGSEFSTFGEKIKSGQDVALICGSLIWGTATISSDVAYSKEIIWKDKLYPYRAALSEIRVFRSPISFTECKVDEIFRSQLGKQWAFKILFTPGEVPKEAVEVLKQVFNKAKLLEPSEYPQFFISQIKEFEKQKRKRLGLNSED